MPCLTAAGILREHLDIFINPEERCEGEADRRHEDLIGEVNKNLFGA